MSENPFTKPVTDVHAVQPNLHRIVVLERIEPGVVPDYCVHGKVTCYLRCGEWCWLGSQTYEIVRAGEAAPVCMECAIKLNEMHPLGDPTSNAGDHRE